uniref:Uncharacterized protein n=1 Tax=Romanomermis culicivorax TaxID=13658 RepID=A0A915INA3_ROMCU
CKLDFQEEGPGRLEPVGHLEAPFREYQDGRRSDKEICDGMIFVFQRQTPTPRTTASEYFRLDSR